MGKKYFSSSWNRFDFFLVLVSAFILTMQVYTGQNSSGGNVAAISRLARLFRIMRVFRSLRVLRVLKVIGSLAKSFVRIHALTAKFVALVPYVAGPLQFIAALLYLWSLCSCSYQRHYILPGQLLDVNFFGDMMIQACKQIPPMQTP